MAAPVITWLARKVDVGAYTNIGEAGWNLGTLDVAMQSDIWEHKLWNSENDPSKSIMLDCKIMVKTTSLEDNVSGGTLNDDWVGFQWMKIWSPSVHTNPAPLQFTDLGAGATCSIKGSTLIGVEGSEYNIPPNDYAEFKMWLVTPSLAVANTYTGITRCEYSYI